jgi:hypothetical protein
VLRRAARRRQDLARPVDRARHGPQVRARQPRRRARRGGDPRPSAHLYRRAARQHHPGDPQGRLARLRDDARRDRQARRRHPGRSRPRRCSKCSIPSRTTTFRDNYLGVPFDLSRVVFIATANMLDTIPGRCATAWRSSACRLHRRREAARSRSAIWCAGSWRRTGSSRSRSRSTDEALRDIIADYTREAGVRSLEREIGRVLRHAACDRRGQAAPIRIGRDDLAAILGAPVRERGGDAHQRAGRRDRPRLDAGRRRHPVHRGDAHARFRPADPDRPARRRDEGERAGRAQPGQEAAPPRSASTRAASRRATSTSTCRPARRRRTGRARASRCSWRWPR